MGEASFSGTDLGMFRACNMNRPELISNEKDPVLYRTVSSIGCSPKRPISRNTPGYKGRILSRDSFISSLDTLYTNDGTNSMFYDFSKRTESSR